MALNRANPFAEGKVQINMAAALHASGVLQKAGARPDTIPAGTRLIAIASNECMVEESHELSEKVYNYDQEFANLDEQGYTWTTDHEMSVGELQTLAAEDPCIKGVANDAVLNATTTPNDPYLGSESQFTSIGGPDTYAFFNDSTHGSTSPVVVAVIDSGITPGHPDLQNQLWHDGSGNFGYNYKNPGGQPIDDYGHGTNVSGLIAAESNNAVGVAGVMGHNIQLMSLKVQDSNGSGYISDIVSAIYYAISNGAQVINISMVGYGANASLQSALQTAANGGIFIAVAAGNDALTLSTSSSSTYGVPAIYGAGISGMMTVGSVNALTNARSSFSNISNSYVEIAAPGSGGLYFTSMPNSYKSGEGTSFSSPQVAGAAALIVSFFKKNGITYTAADVENALTASAYPSSSLSSYFAGGRILDLRGIKEYLQNTYLGSQTGGFDDY